MKLVIAAVLCFTAMNTAHAAPVFNNQEQVKGNDKAMTLAVANESQPVQAEVPQVKQDVPSPQPQTVTETGNIELPPPQPIRCGDNQYANFIYMHESSCRTDAVNSIGCRGIGQACPGDKLPCGDDYECQNIWFTNYAIQRYGSWEQAYYFWLENLWW